MFSLRAIILSGGRLPKRLQAKYGVEVKSLIPYEGRTLLQIAIDSAVGVPAIEQPVGVVGPEQVRSYVGRYENRVVWLMEGATIVDNVERGARYFGWENSFLIISPDLPLLTPGALAEFINNLPEGTELSVAIIPKRDFLDAFPNSPNRFARLAEGDFTMGSVFFASGLAVQKNLGLLRDAYRARKNLLKLALMLGFPMIIKVLLGKGRLAEIEKRVSLLTDANGKCVVLRDATLAYDIDNELNLRYLNDLRRKQQ